jgi:transposase
MRQGDTDRAIARARLMGRRKAGEVREVAEAAGWLDPAVPLPDEATLAQRLGRRRPKPSTASRIEPHAKQVEAWHRQGVQGTTIHAALVRRHGFDGSYSSVRRYLRRLAPPPKATPFLDFEPGEAAQVDFGRGPEIEGRGTWFFVMTLAWSRHAYAELVWDQTVATWLGCHQRAFAFFGGVSRRVVVDNAKCAITRACLTDPEVQRGYAELAEGYGFRIDPCPPHDPQKKGRVEAGVKYVKRSFLPLRDFRDLADANRQLSAWLLGEAGNRVHGTTRERPLTQFVEVERPLLLPLPDRTPEAAEWTQAVVSTQAHVQFQKALYSVPFRLVAQTLWLRATASSVQIFADHTLVAVHRRLTRPGERSTVDDHLPPDVLVFRLHDPAWCRSRAGEIGPATGELVGELLAHPWAERLRAAQGVLRLGERFGPTRLEAACRRAMAFADPRYRTVKTILERGLDAEAAPEDAPDRLADAYTGAGRFSRDTRNLLVR